MIMIASNIYNESSKCILFVLCKIVIIISNVDIAVNSLVSFVCLRSAN